MKMLKRNHSPEKELLIQLSCEMSAPSALEKDKSRLEEFDWEWLIQSAVHHRIAALIGYRLASDDKSCLFLPPKIKERFNKIDSIALRQYEYFKDEIKDILLILNKENIKAAILKGPAFSNLYPKPYLHQFNYLDIFVSESSVGKIREILSGLGYDKSLNPDLDSLALNSFSCPWGGYVRSNDFPVVKTDHELYGLQVVVHAPQHMSFGPWGMIDTSEWLEDAVPTTIYDEDVLLLSNEDELLYYCIHTYAHYIGEKRRLGFLLDISLLIRKGINWSRFLAKVLKYNKAEKEIIEWIKQQIFSLVPDDLHQDLGEWFDASDISDQVNYILSSVNEIFGPIVPQHMLRDTIPKSRNLPDALEGPDGKLYLWKIPYKRRILDFPDTSGDSFKIAKEADVIEHWRNVPDIPISGQMLNKLWCIAPRVLPKKAFF